MSKLASREISETLRDAEVYLKSLQSLEEQLNSAEEQIKISTETTEKQIEEVFSGLLEDVTQMLVKRKLFLLKNTKKISEQGLTPITASKKVIEYKQKQTEKFIEMIKAAKEIDLEDFRNKASMIGSLPVAPDLKDVNFITFQMDRNTQKHIKEYCLSIGRVFPKAPVQISALLPKPGAILVLWSVIDSDDPYAEVQEYCLQKAQGNGACNSSVVFSDCYKGLELEYLQRELIPQEEYSFRVSCKFEGKKEYSPWSIIQVARTELPHYKWAQNKDFELSKERRIALCQNPSVVTSDGPQFAVGNTLDFTFLKVDEISAGNYIGLILPNVAVDDESILKEGTFLLEASGNIYIDGVLKSTKLPEAFAKCKVTFNCTPLQDDKIRLNIDVCDKRVTYDWWIDKYQSLNFMAKFASPKWKVLVE